MGSLAAMHVARVLGAVGRTCITLGVLILLFVVYQLWGTGIREAQAQNKLENEFEALLGGPDVTAPETTSTTATTQPNQPPPPPAEGDAMARLLIPTIGVDKIVVEGVTLDDLKRGPGHYPDAPMPGQRSCSASPACSYGSRPGSSACSGRSGRRTSCACPCSCCCSSSSSRTSRACCRRTSSALGTDHGPQPIARPPAARRAEAVWWLACPTLESGGPVPRDGGGGKTKQRRADQERTPPPG